MLNWKSKVGRGKWGRKYCMKRKKNARLAAAQDPWPVALGRRATEEPSRDGALYPLLIWAWISLYSEGVVRADCSPGDNLNICPFSGVNVEQGFPWPSGVSHWFLFFPNERDNDGHLIGSGQTGTTSFTASSCFMVPTF
jgi:hypothetical protein